MLQPLPLSKMNKDGSMHPVWGQWFNSLIGNVNRGSQPTIPKEVIASSGVLVGTSNQEIRVFGPTTGTTEVTANPQIGKGFDGQIIKISGTNDDKKLKLNSGNGLRLVSAQSITLGAGSVINLHYNALLTLWIEDSRNE